ncbi:MAG: mismatch-specific DNA-glycosylase [Peptococcaceae bacterium]
MEKGLPDYLRNNLRILFIGYNPSIRSADSGHHYAGRNNRFWKLLFEAGLTPRLYCPEEDDKLLELGYGLTNIVARPTKAAGDLTAEDYKEGRKRLYNVLQRYKPLIACYVGIGVYKEFAKNRKAVPGLQSNSVVRGVVDFAAPSSSGLNRMLFQDQLSYYKELYRLLNI